MVKRDSSFASTVLALILFLLLGTTASGATVAELREQLLTPGTAAVDRGALISRLMMAGSEGDVVLREVLAGPDEELVLATVRSVLTRVHEPLLGDVLPRARKRDLEDCRSPGLVRALTVRAGKAGSGDAGTALLAIEMAGGRDAVVALMDLWEAEVTGARGALRRLLLKDFPSAEQARAWWAGQSGKSYETILLEIGAELARPSADAESVRDRLAKLRLAHIELARAGLADARASHVARYYLGSELVEIRRLGAEFLGTRENLSPEDVGPVSEALLLALARIDEETNTLVALLAAARVHVAGLRTLEPKGRAYETVVGLRDRTEREVRDRWVDLLGDLGDARATADLETLYETADSAMRGRVIGALMRLGNGVARWARKALDAQLEIGAGLDPEVTGKLVNLLGKHGGSEDVAVLARVLRDVKSPDSENAWAEKIRRFAAEALGTAGVARNSPEAIRALIVIGLRDASSGVRLKAAAALAGARGSDEALAGLEGLLRADDMEAVRHQAGISILALLDADAAPWIAAHVGSDEVLLGLLDDAVKKALVAAKLVVLRDTVEALLPVDPARTETYCGLIGEASWPESGRNDLARVRLVQARALCAIGESRRALAILDGIPVDASLPVAARVEVRAIALRGSGEAADAVRIIDEFLSANTTRPADTVTLLLERVRALLAIPRLDEALAAHGSLAERVDLTEANRQALAALGQRIEDARSGGGAAAEALVARWLGGIGGEDAEARVRALGVRAYPALRARLVGLTDTEKPELGAFLAKLRTLTGREFGYAKATTPGARAAARGKWLAFLSSDQ